MVGIHKSQVIHGIITNQIVFAICFLVVFSPTCRLLIFPNGDRVDIIFWDADNGSETLGLIVSSQTHLDEAAADVQDDDASLLHLRWSFCWWFLVFFFFL